MTNDARVEWVGGLTQIPVRIEDEGISPEGLFWLDPQGLLLGSEIGRPGELAERAGASLRDAMERPRIGDPHRPQRLRVASADLAAGLRAEHPDIEVVCAPTPELDDAVADLVRQLDEARRQRDAYLPSEPLAVASFFRAAAHLYRARPWTRGDEFFLATIDDLGVNLATVAVMGQGAGERGLLVFWRPEDVVSFMDGAEAIIRGEAPVLPPHLALTFGPVASTTVAAEAAARGWAVADDVAFPTIRSFANNKWRQSDAREMAILEALALALPLFLVAVSSADRADATVGRMIAVRAHRGRTVVKLLAVADRDHGKRRTRAERRAWKRRRKADAKARRRNR
jgi:hypothetical protein